MQRSAAKRIHRITSWLTSARRCMVHGGKYMYVYINIVSNTIILRSLRTSCTSFLRVVRTVISDASSSPQLGSHSGDTSRAGETLEDVRCCLFVVYLRTPRSAPARTESLVIFFYFYYYDYYYFLSPPTRFFWRVVFRQTTLRRSRVILVIGDTLVQEYRSTV